MRYFALVPDGCGDWPIESLDGKTPLEAVKMKNINAIAKKGTVGLVKTIPDGLTPNSVPANLSILGFDPLECQTGRAPLEAVAAGIALGEKDLAYRVNLVTLEGEGEFETLRMKDHSAGEISSGEARELMDFLNAELGGYGASFYAGMGYRCVMTTESIESDEAFTPPHDILDRQIGEYLPRHEASKIILKMMRRANGLLKDHPVNKKRAESGQNIANGIWVWDQGKNLRLESVESRFGVKGTVVAAVNLIKGMGVCAGLHSVDVPGADGTLNTNFSGKAKAAIGEFKSGKNFVYVHVEAPDECSHTNDLQGKLDSLEKIDGEIFKPVYDYLASTGEPFRLLVVTDHKTPLAIRTHNAEPVPFVMYDSEYENEEADWKAFSESSGERGVFIESGRALAEAFFDGSLG